jgi:4-amino-4-deoxy-L-arabinose transferase-like glycosyltransferase
MVSRKVSGGPAHLPAGVALLLLYAFTRLHRLLAMPLFVDESFHIETAQRALKGQVLASASHGRFMRVWLNAFLGPDPPAAGWMARAGTVLVGLVGVAAFYALARAVISPRAGVIAAVLWIACPYLLFFERMALADPLLGALSAVAVWLAWRVMRRGDRWDAVRLGGALAAMILAKAPGVVWLPLPLVAGMLALDRPWRQRLELVSLAYSLLALCWVPLDMVLRLKDYNYFGLASTFVDAPGDSGLDRLLSNIGDTWQADLAYLSLPLVILAVLSELYWLRRRPVPAVFALTALGMSAGGALVFGRHVNSRYALNHVAWVLLPLAVGAELAMRRGPRWRIAVYGALAGWIAVFCLPFAWDAWHQPDDLPLVGNDPAEYVRGEASGYGVTAVGDWLRTQGDPLPVLGLVANCQALRLAAYPVEVTCPTIHWDNTSQDVIMAQAEAWAAAGPVYVVGEDLPYIDLSGLPQPFAEVIVVARPDGGLPVGLYLLAPGATRPPSES